MILISRIDIEERERNTLAGYAARASESRGRQYPQEPHPLRTDYQRDRDRIVHAAAFRRMEYKTQVFIPHLADHFRTRLTHTIEVAQISRTLARNLRLNEDLTEAIALVHDLGHTPFGHTGEDVLNDLLKDLGGFNHNRQSLRIVDLLERHYPGHPGLNLTYEVREGIVKHESKGSSVPEEFSPGEQATLEATLVDRADELTYSSHDIDDGLSSGLLELSDLGGLAVWEGDKSLVQDLKGGPGAADSDSLRYRLVRFLINTMATDLLTTTAAELERQSITGMESLRAAQEPICRYSDGFKPKVIELKRCLSEKLYHHPHLQLLAQRSQELIRFLFDRLTENTALLPHRYQTMLESARVETVVADYIAGMTDRFAERQAEHLK
jgi:dGTPase